MTLSPRAKRMIERLPRRDNPRDRATIAAACAAAGWPCTEALLQFARDFDGVSYRVRGHEDGLDISLLWPPLTADNRFDHTAPLVVDAWLEDDDDPTSVRYDCATHTAAQVGFDIDTAGTLYIDYVPVNASMAVFVESDAMRDELVDLQPTWVWTPLRSVALPGALLDGRAEQLRLARVPEASDIYSTWWQDRDLRLSQQVYWDGTGKMKHIALYARTADALRNARAVLDPTADAADDPILPWPWSPVEYFHTQRER